MRDVVSGPSDVGSSFDSKPIRYFVTITKTHDVCRVRGQGKLIEWVYLHASTDLTAAQDFSRAG